MKSSDYWKARMLAVEAHGYKIGYEAYKESEQALKLAERELIRQIEKWIWRIADENGISYAEAKKLLTAGELEEFKWDVNEYIAKGKENAIDAAWLHELENASARAHISRLEAMRLQLREYIETAFHTEHTATETALTKIYESDYYHTAYEIQKGVNVGYEIGGINEKAINQAIKKPWAADGKDFSSRIWDNKARMVGELEQELTRQIITGDSPDAAIEALTKHVKDDIANARQKAGTLIMTESAAIGNQAQRDSFKALGVEEFEVVETLDTHTCEKCGDMDSRHFPMEQFEISVTAPPFHPNCRGCIAPYFDDEFQPQKRAARDPETGKTVQVGNMTYEEWKSGQEKSEMLASGARITNPESDEGKEFATMYYEEIRHMSTDVQRIADNLGYNPSEIKRIKDYLFINESWYHEGTGTSTRFEPDCAIAQSWQRLMQGKDIKKHDRTLIEHEIYEMKLKRDNPGITHQKAHDLAQEKYNYARETDEFYDSIKKHKKNS